LQNAFTIQFCRGLPISDKGSISLTLWSKVQMGWCTEFGVKAAAMFQQQIYAQFNQCTELEVKTKFYAKSVTPYAKSNHRSKQVACKF
jgi:hypothetical protein